ncbi:MAG: hypothetical protein MJ152_03315 [Clostridia bacterium]|nr:hypothetical protein [Clostridia bacterium]
MESGKKWSTVVDYFLILSAIIGVGFASGKEIYVFFFDYGAASLLGLVAFCLLYFYLFFVVNRIKNKLEIKSYNQFNSIVFGVFSKIASLVMFVNFSITSAGMLAGAEYLCGTFFGIGYKIPTIVLAILTFFLLLGGVNKIKLVANFIIPIMIGTIIINSIKNINPSNVNFPIVEGNSHMAILYGILFGVNNFVAALPVFFETNLKGKWHAFVIITIGVIILLNLLVFASNAYETSMPMFELSANVNRAFYYVYFATLLFALFSTLMICTHNMQTLLCGEKRNIFVSVLVVIFVVIISNFGYDFIVKYLYVVSSLISGILVVAMVLLIAIKLLKTRRKSKFESKN